MTKPDPVPPYLRATNSGITISIVVKPGAKKFAIIGVHGDRLKIAVDAPPVDGKANEALIRGLSELLHLPQSQLSIIKGQTGRQKTVLISGVNIKAVGLLLDSAARRD